MKGLIGARLGIENGEPAKDQRRARPLFVAVTAVGSAMIEVGLDRIEQVRRKAAVLFEERGKPTHWRSSALRSAVGIAVVIDLFA